MSSENSANDGSLSNAYSGTSSNSMNSQMQQQQNSNSDLWEQLRSIQISWQCEQKQTNKQANKQTNFCQYRLLETNSNTFYPVLSYK